MKKKSAGILPFLIINNEVQFFIVHPGGPFFTNKDHGYWGIAKGEFEENEDPLKAAKREFKEETSVEIDGEFMLLLPAKLKSGKIIHAWAIEVQQKFENLKSNEFELEWPPKSGLIKKFPEVDRYLWCNPEEAILKLNPAQAAFIHQVLEKIN